MESSALTIMRQVRIENLNAPAQAWANIAQVLIWKDQQIVPHFI